MIRLLLLSVLLFHSLPHLFGQNSVPDGSMQPLSFMRNELPAVQNGNGTLGVFFDTTACGLNYAVASQKLGQRFTPAGVTQPAPFVISGLPLNASVIKAFLIANGSGNGAAQTATIAGPAGTYSYPMTITGTDVDMCWMMASTRTYRADVTTSIAGNGTYNVSGLLTCPPSPLTNDMNGALLVVIYNEPTVTYDARIVLSDGALTVLGGTGTYNMSFSPVCTTPTASTAFCMVSDFQFANSTVTMNNDATNVTGDRWNFITVATNINSGQSSCSFLATKAGDCFCLCIAGLYMQTQACIACPSTLSGNLQCTVASTSDVCNQCNGTASVTSVSGGSAPFAFQWGTVPVQNAMTATGLCAGTYSVIVTSNGGLYADTQFVTVPAQGSLPSLLSASQTDVLCFGGNTGTATLSVSGGQSPYTFAWNPSVTNTVSGNSSTATGLGPGTYSVVITEAGGCSTSHSFIITQPAVLTGTMTSTSSLCYGDSACTATVFPSGGTLPYTYSWWPYGGNSATASGLDPRTYIVTTTDANGCSITTSIIPTEPPQLVVGISGNDVYCYGNNTGYIVTNVGGGTPGYSWLWNTGDTTYNLSNLSPGSYSVTVTDSVGCIETNSWIITEPPLLVVSGIVTQTSACAASDGAIDVTVTGGTAPYYFYWNTGDSTLDIINLPAGIYTVFVSDAYSCSSTVTFTVQDPNPTPVTFDEPNDTLCSNSNPVLISGGFPVGGTFSGSAVSGNYFDPANAMQGYNIIYYQYTDSLTLCQSMVTDSIYVDICNSINAELSSTLNVYPNPSSGVIIVETQEKMRLELFDAQGKLLVVQNIPGGRIFLNLSEYSDGIYLLNLSNGELHQTCRVILSRQ